MSLHLFLCHAQLPLSDTPTSDSPTPLPVSAELTVAANLVRNYSPHLPPSTREAPAAQEIRRILREEATVMIKSVLQGFKGKGKQKQQEVIIRSHVASTQYSIKLPGDGYSPRYIIRAVGRYYFSLFTPRKHELCEYCSCRACTSRCRRSRCFMYITQG